MFYIGSKVWLVVILEWSFKVVLSVVTCRYWSSYSTERLRCNVCRYLVYVIILVIGATAMIFWSKFYIKDPVMDHLNKLVNEEVWLKEEVQVHGTRNREQAVKLLLASIIESVLTYWYKRTVCTCSVRGASACWAILPTLTNSLSMSREIRDQAHCQNKICERVEPGDKASLSPTS